MTLRSSRLILLVLVSLTAAASVTGCIEDPMYDRGRIKPLEPNAFFDDGRSARQPPAGTIARGQLQQDGGFYTGRGPDGQLLEQAPIEITQATLRRGQSRYNAFCAPCHGAVGDSNGMIVLRGFSTPPSLHSDRLRETPDGHIFDVTTNGYGKMPPYRHQVPAVDRWAIIAYIRALQRSQNATLDDVSAEQRAQLMEAGRE